MLVDRKYRVVGVFDEKKSAFGVGFDNYVLMPVTTFLNVYGLTGRDGTARSVNITVRAKTPNSCRSDRPDAPDPRAQRAKAGEDNFDFYNSEILITRFNKMSAGGIAVAVGLIA